MQVACPPVPGGMRRQLKEICSVASASLYQRCSP